MSSCLYCKKEIVYYSTYNMLRKVGGNALVIDKKESYPVACDSCDLKLKTISYKKILVSIHHEHAVKILKGEKTVELRRTAPKDWEVLSDWIKRFKDIDTLRLIYKVLMYDTTLKKVIGVFETKIKKTEKSIFLENFDNNASKYGVSREFAEEYIGSRDYIFEWQVIGVGELANPYALPTGKRPPQSWCYFDTIFKE